MTVKEKTICNMIKAFPVLLIIAQKHEKCLDTPFTYQPPHPTHSTDYYEALEALFQSLHHPTEAPEAAYDCHSYYAYGKGYYGPQHKPCHGYQHSTGYAYYTTPTYPQFGTGQYDYHNKYPDPNAGTLYGINSWPHYKKHNKTGGNTGYGHAHHHTGSPKIKVKVVLKKNKYGQHQRTSEKLQNNVNTGARSTLNITISADNFDNDDVVEVNQKLEKQSTLHKTNYTKKDYSKN